MDGIAIDTHMKRVTYRLGLTKEKDPVKIEQDLMEKIPRKDWLTATYRIIDHGRAVCKAPVPVCSGCKLNKMCPKVGVTKKK